MLLRDQAVEGVKQCKCPGTIIDGNINKLLMKMFDSCFVEFHLTFPLSAGAGH